MKIGDHKLVSQTEPLASTYMSSRVGLLPISFSLPHYTHHLLWWCSNNCHQAGNCTCTHSCTCMWKCCHSVVIGYGQWAAPPPSQSSYSPTPAMCTVCVLSVRYSGYSYLMHGWTVHTTCIYMYKCIIEMLIYLIRCLIYGWTTTVSPTPVHCTSQ